MSPSERGGGGVPVAARIDQRVAGRRRHRALTLPDLLENHDITPVIFAFLDLASVMRMGGVDKGLRALRLTTAVEEVSSEDLGCNRLHFLRLVCSSQGGYAGLRRVFMNKGLEEDSHAAVCELLRQGACPRLETLDISESNVTDSRLLRIYQSMQKGRTFARTGSQGSRPLPLRDLRLNNNPIGNAGAATLAALVRDHLPTLRHLHLIRVRVTQTGVKTIFQALASPPARNALESLSFSTCLVTAAELAPLFDSLRVGGFRRLTRLDLTFLPLRDEGMKQLCLSLQNGPCPSLETLVLARTQVGKAGLESLSASVTSTSWAQRLAHLNMAGNLFGHEQGVHVLSQALRRGGLPGLRELLLAECGLNPQAMNFLFTALSEQACPKLRLLDVSTNLMGDGGAFQLFSALVRTSPTLLPLLTAGPGHRVESQSACGIEVLNLSNCCLQTTGIVAFGSTLQGGHLPHLRVLQAGDEVSFAGGLCTLTEALRSGGCPQLKELTLSSLKEDDASQSIAAAVALADALEGPLSSSLRVLQLYRVFVGPCVAATALARALHRVRQLEILHLEGSELGTPGVQAISTALCHGACPRLTILCLSGNDAGDQGMVALAAALSPPRPSFPRSERPLSHLRTLRLARNRIGLRGVRALAQAFHSGGCRRLMALDLDDNPLGDRGVALLMSSLLPAPPSSAAAQARPSKRLRVAGGAPSAAGELDGDKAGSSEDVDEDQQQQDGSILPARLTGLIRSAGRGFRRLLGWGAMRQDPDGEHE